MKSWKTWTLLAAIGVAGYGIASMGSLESPVKAADHTEAPGAASAGAADLNDLYVWHADDNVTIALTYAVVMPGADPVYDRDTIYTIHIDNGDDDQEDNQTINVRFGQNDSSEWGVWVQNLPGAGGDVVGAAGGTIDAGATQVYTGVRDDPFFFDGEGFGQTIMNATAGPPDADLAFDPARDSFAGGNTMAVVLEFPASELMGAGPYNVWASTGGAE